MADTKIAFVTGATGGIGKQIALGLARQNHHVIIGARNAAKGAAVRDELEHATGNANVRVAALDVASIASINALDLGVDHLDILINNAGVWYSDREHSIDGIEITFATNVLGPYLVTETLRPLLSAKARVVNVVSAFANHYDATDLEFARRPYDGFKAYAQSKLALRMLTWGLARRLAGTKITANAAAPGFVKTDFAQHAHGFRMAMIKVSAKLFAVSPEKGAETPLWAATATELDGVTGEYLDALKEKESKFRDPVAIADLERRCAEYASAARRAA